MYPQYVTEYWDAQFMILDAQNLSKCVFLDTQYTEASVSEQILKMKITILDEQNKRMCRTKGKLDAELLKQQLGFTENVNND